MGAKYLILFAIGVGFNPFIYTSSYGSSSDKSAVSLGAGVLSQNAGRTTNTVDGATSFYSTVYEQISLTAMLPFGDSSWGFSPVLTYTPLGRKSPDNGLKSTVLCFGSRLFIDFGGLDLKLGPGLMFYKMSGSGGTLDLSNGAGTTTFGLPSDSATATLLYANAGLGISFSIFRIDLDFLMTGALSSKRAVNPVLTLSVGLF